MRRRRRRRRRVRRRCADHRRLRATESDSARAVDDGTTSRRRRHLAVGPAPAPPWMTGPWTVGTVGPCSAGVLPALTPPPSAAPSWPRMSPWAPPAVVPPSPAWPPRLVSPPTPAAVPPSPAAVPPPAPFAVPPSPQLCRRPRRRRATESGSCAAARSDMGAFAAHDVAAADRSNAQAGTAGKARLTAHADATQWA
ncbi:hypothetical protein BZL30_7103 [Mycobacterium kansasii]|uniref:Uncharacterized protein n=1 Tax=Mycobacterium kansasii TaxID=1768 RepID=A0A1V3WPN5_MYCKA|nr:hypothetical protein BZL30_7103 [Mycobacterium kansasii]